MKLEIAEEKMLTVIMWLVLFFPQFQVYVGLALEQLLSVIGTIFAITIVFYMKGKFRYTHIMYILVFLILITISLIRGTNYDFSYKDVFELSKPLYLGSFFLLSFCIDWTKEKITYVFDNLIIALFILSIMGFLESLTGLGNSIGSTIYKDARGGVQYKAVASFISPYVFGSVLLIPLYYSMVKLIHKFSVKYLIMTFVFLFAMLLTQSRTVFLAFIFTFIPIFIYVIAFDSYIARAKMIIYIVAIASVSLFSLPFIISYVQNNLPYLYQGLNLLYEQLINFDLKAFIYSSPSIEHRYEQLMFAINSSDQVAVFGVGIGKNLFRPESFYALYLYRVGLIGVLLHIMIVLLTTYKAHKISRLFKEEKKLNFIFISIVFYLFSIPSVYISSALNDQVRSGFIYYLLVGMIFKVYQDREKIR